MEPITPAQENPSLVDLISARRSITSAIEVLLKGDTEEPSLDAYTHATHALHFISSVLERFNQTAPKDLSIRVLNLELKCRTLEKKLNSVVTPSKLKELETELQDQIDELDKRTRGIAK